MAVAEMRPIPEVSLDRGIRNHGREDRLGEKLNLTIFPATGAIMKSPIHNQLRIANGAEACNHPNNLLEKFEDLVSLNKIHLCGL
mmetsp:Transcript_468/g.1052  ORF Transcript_468/g.1052 Transcript_468/m.1052 type:complete len:85 (+) Transcript_468:128-382(+)